MEKKYPASICGDPARNFFCRGNGNGELKPDREFPRASLFQIFSGAQVKKSNENYNLTERDIVSRHNTSSAFVNALHQTIHEGNYQ